MHSEVILVNEADEQVGLMEKMQAHKEARLHRAFSIFIFNDAGDMLVQQRALDKYHSAGLWTNACCSHPLPGEFIEAAAHRRLREEMGFTTGLQFVFNFIYQCSFANGLYEHEFDHVFTGKYNGEIIPDPAEIMDWKFLPVQMIKVDIDLHPEKYTAWFKIAFPKMLQYLATHS